MPSPTPPNSHSNSADSLATATAILGDLVAFPTISHDSNLKLAEYVAHRLSEAGAKVVWDKSPCKTKANLFATLGAGNTNGREKGMRRGIILAGHTDVVPVEGQTWSHAPFAMHSKNDRLYGRGCCDMKGFLALLLAKLGRLTEATRQSGVPIYLAFTYDEEVGCIGAGRLTAMLAKHDIHPRLAIIGEPTEMKVIDGHKGCCHYSTHFSGLAGHGSDPDKGVNAAEYAAGYAMRLLGWREKLKAKAPATSPYLPPYSTINIGRLEGGAAHNIIADKARLDWEMRPVAEADLKAVKVDLAEWSAATLLPAMQARHADASIRLEVLAEAPSLGQAKNNTARDIMLEVTGENTSAVAAYCTEAGVFQGAGMECVVCGPGSINQAHKADEYIEVSQLQLGLATLDKIADRIAAGVVGV